MNKIITLNNFNIEFIYEDENLIALNKPEGLASIHDKNGKEKDLQTFLSEYFHQKIYVLHRLDKEVSGIILYAKNIETHKFINKQFENRLVKKTYLALVHGVIKKNSGVIDSPIREFGSGRMGIDVKGKTSKTFYVVLEKYSKYTLVELNPTTGRKHQLRVHLYSIGFPIVGDMKYGNKEIQKSYPRLMLHAKSIALNINPTKKIYLEAESSKSFSSFINNLK